MDQEDVTNHLTAGCSQPFLLKKRWTATDRGSAAQQPISDGMSSRSKWVNSSTEDTDPFTTGDGLSNGTCEGETMVALHCAGDSGDATAEGDHFSLSTDGLSEFSNSDLSLPEVCVSTNSNSFEEDMNYEVQQAYKIFTGFLSDKHKGITSPFLQPIGYQEAQRGVEGVRGWGQAQPRQSMCLQRMEEKFSKQEYESITEFVADFRLMLENCYRFHGVDHWISKQAQKLEIMLEQKLTLLSRTLREKTTLAVTSTGRFGTEEERTSGGTSTRRRLAPRSLATIIVGGHESIMVQTLRLEEQQRAKDEKRQRELEKKEAEEMSAKEVEEWEKTLLSHASPDTVDTLWELPAIGHFLCLAQTALNLPEIIFFDLERCLLMPRCSTLLSKIMSSLLSPPQRRPTLHRRPALPYRRWESELRQRVMAWYRTVGASHDQPGRAEQLGLCHQFFVVLGEVSPLEEKPFHLLPFYQRVWLLKGLCDHVYETQRDVQGALLSQPIHECRESILGYDSKENAYIHFPHFCGADLRIYCQSPSTPPAFPFPSVWVKRVENLPGTEADHSDGMNDEALESVRRCYGGTVDTGESDDFENGSTGTLGIFKRENWDGEDATKMSKSSSLKEEESELGSSGDDSKVDSNICSTSSTSHTHRPFGGRGVEKYLKEETVEMEHQSRQLTLKQERGFPTGAMRTIKAETQEPCLSVGEHCYTGRSPARLVRQTSPIKSVDLPMESEGVSQGHQRSSCSESETCRAKSDAQECCCSTSAPATPLSSESAPNSGEERMGDKMWTKKKRRKRKRVGERPLRVKGEHRQLQHEQRMRLSADEAAKSAGQGVTKIKRKDKKKKHKTGKKLESSKNDKDEPAFEPSFMLVCTSLEELRRLISKTEDELDDLESTKKRMGRWYYKREAVKDLHSTLIRLLNELLPWEPKLVKAFQRNRLRLKKEFDDFKKHPEYNNFVREECISSSSSSSSSSSDDDVESGLGKEICSRTDHYRRSEEEDLENRVPRGLWNGASARELEAESAGETMLTHVPPNHLNPPLASIGKDIGLLPRLQTGSSDITSIDSEPPSRTELIRVSQSRDSSTTLASSVPTHASLSLKSAILHPTTGLPKGYTPIPSLLAKSVGNKVTLMKRPADYPGVSNMDRRSKGSLVSLPTSPVSTTKHTEVQSSSWSQLSSEQMQTQRLKQTEVLKQPEMLRVTAALPKSPQTNRTQTAPVNPAQMVNKIPERLGHLVRTDDTSAVKLSVHPVVDQKTGEAIMQQVVILPSNVIHKTEEPTSSSHQSKGIQGSDSKVAIPFCMSTNVPGFTIPENSIRFQQVAPLKDARTLRTPTPSVSPRPQQGSMITAGFKGTQVCSPQASTKQGAMPCPSPITPSCAIPTEPTKSTGPIRELKTVCIRDSQSILVTTRGGNTGIVKVQTSSDLNALGCMSTNPVITISPQFKAFLISKATPTLSPSAFAQTSPCTLPPVTSISLTQPQNQISSASKPPSTVQYPVPTAVTCSTSVITGPGSQATNTTFASGPGSNHSAGSTAATMFSPQTQRASTGSHFQAPLVKNTVVVPSLNSSGHPQVLTQAEFISKTGVKRASTDERPQPPKFILVSPSSSSASNTALSKGTTGSANSPPTSRVMFVSQPTATASSTSLGSIPKQAIATGAGGQLLTSSLSSQTLKMGLSPGHPVGIVNSETLSMVKNVNLPSGIQIQLPGKTTNIGQTIGALSYSPSKSTPASIFDTGHPAAATTGLLLATTSNHTITSCSDLLASHTSLTTTSQLQCIPSFAKLSQADSSSFAAPSTALTAAEMIKHDVGTPSDMLSSISPAQMTTTVPMNSAQTSTHTCAPQPSTIQRGTGEETTSFLSSSQLAVSQIQASLSSSRATNTQPTPSATVQQRIVINTSTPLAAGTQILLNNARFVVPPQGLGPGSHVLIISSPAPQQVPTASATNTVASRASVLSRSLARLPYVSSSSCPFAARTPAVAPSPIPTYPKVGPIGSPVAPGLGSNVPPCNTNVVSALPRFPATQTGHFGSPPVASPTLLSSPPRISNAPALLSSAAVSSSLATMGCSPALSPAAPAPHPLSRLSTLSSLPVLPNSTVPATLSSAVAPVAAGTPASPSSLPAKQVASVTVPGLVIPPQRATHGIAAPSTALSQTVVHTGLDNMSIKTTGPVVTQPELAGIRTHVLPPVAVSPFVSSVSRMQTLPMAAVTPIGSLVSTFETAPGVTPPASSSSALNAPAQPIASLRTNNSIHPPIVLTTQALGKYSLRASSLDMQTNLTSKLLISPDGAVLSTVQCQVNPAELTACPKPTDALMASYNSATGAAHTQDSSSQANRECAN